MQIQNHVFIITGGENGIGRELVMLLLAKSAMVIAIDKDEHGLLDQSLFTASTSALRSLNREFLRAWADTYRCTGRACMGHPMRRSR